MSLFSSRKFVAACGCLSALFLGLLAPARAFADEATKVRLAVIGDAESQDLSALVVTELSSRPGVALVEREELSRLGDEHKLQQLAGSDAIALGKLVGADGLLFVDKTAAGYKARFTAVGLGYALFDDGLGVPKDQEQLARSLAHRVAGYASKLRLNPAKTTPLSILNLRADLATTQSTALERDLTLLLESRLASAPGYVVLERRHAWSLGFEHGLDPAARPLLHSAYLIDGTLSLAAGGEVTVALRVRLPGGGESVTSVRGTVGDLPALVDRILPEIAHATGHSLAAPASTGPEAEEYLREGLWGWRAKANQAALEALDSAELLGANLTDVDAVRLLVLASLIDEGMENWFPSHDPAGRDTNFPKFDAVAMTRKTDAALRAIRDVTLSRATSAADSAPNVLPALSAEKFWLRNGSTRDQIVYRGSKLLCVLDQAAFPRANELRQAVRTLAEFDPLHGHAGLLIPIFNDQFAGTVFADDWAQNREEELAYYRLVCTDQVMVLPRAHSGWRSTRFCARFLPRVADRPAAFAKFVASLKDKPECHFCYLLLSSDSENDADADRAYRNFLGDLWKQRETLATVKDNRPLWWNLDLISDEVKPRNVPAGMALLHFLLTCPKLGSWNLSLLELLWQPAGFPPAEAATLWNEFGACRHRLASTWNAQDYRESFGPTAQTDDDYSEKVVESRTARMADDFRDKFPQIADTSQPSSRLPKPSTLAITKFWHPWLSPDHPPADKDDPDKGRGEFELEATAVVEDGVWVECYFNQLEETKFFKLTLPGFQTECIGAAGEEADSFIVTPEALYGTHSGDSANGWSNGDTERHLDRYDFATRTWASRELPFYFHKQFSALKSILYLSLTAAVSSTGNEESGLAKYDWKTGKATVLASNRRRPARNQLDDTEEYMVTGVFLGPKNRPCVTTYGNTLYIQEGVGTWPKVFDGAWADRAVTTLGKTLVYNTGGEVTLMDPQAAAPIPWMAAAELLERKDERKAATPWKQQAWCDGPQGSGIGTPAFRDDWLYVLVRPKEKRDAFELLCYRRGKGRAPRRVTLEFQLDPSAAASLPPAAPQRWTVDSIEHPGLDPMPMEMIGTKQGLCFKLWSAGVWFLPYGDIDAYLAAGQR